MERKEFSIVFSLPELPHIQQTVRFRFSNIGSRLPSGGIPFLFRLINFKPQRAGGSKGYGVVHFTLASLCPLWHTPGSGKECPFIFSFLPK